ncbi:MAG: hypothetical protein HQL57_05905 [Magnetococcales bacterium]|nr:hypothetical protein [Magnetococcales bacterium]MBF0156701.1 hypothetical protein [Magnetococcales bacterium]
MSERVFLFLSDHHLVVHTWWRGVFSDAVTFDQGAEGRAQFERFLDETPPEGPVYLVVNLTEEEIRQEAVPRVLGANRTQLLARRAARLFRNTSFHQAISLGRSAVAKGQEEVLFTALTDPETVKGWVELLERRSLCLVGIWSLTLLHRQLFRHLPVASADALVITPVSLGLRQVYFRGAGGTHVSRFISLPDGQDPDSIVLFIHGEVAKIQGYLASLRVMAFGSKLEVFILCHGELLERLQERREEVSTYNCHPVDAVALGRKLGLSRFPPGMNLEPLFGQLLLKERIANHYAPAPLLRFHRSAVARLWIRVGSLLLLIGGMVGGALAFWQGREIGEELPQLSLAANQAQEALQAEFPDAWQQSQEGTGIVPAVVILDTLKGRAVTPETMLVVLGQVMSRHPDLWLDGLDWEVKATPPEPVGGSMGGQGDGRKGPSAPSRDQGERDPSAGKMGETGTSYQVTQFHGQVYPFSDDRREALGKVERFVRDLRARPEIHGVAPISLPFNLNDDAVITGGENAPLDRATFTLRIVMQVHHEIAP